MSMFSFVALILQKVELVQAAEMSIIIGFSLSILITDLYARL